MSDSVELLSNNYGNPRKCVVCEQIFAKGIALEMEETIIAAKASKLLATADVAVDGGTAENIQKISTLNLLSLKDDETKGKPITCDGCNLLQYCSAEHCEFDWPDHKELCELMKSIKTAAGVEHILHINGTPLNAARLKRTIKQLLLFIYVKLKRVPYEREFQLICYPLHCAVCYKIDNIFHCKTCYAISYCCVAHQEADSKRHKNDCIHLRVCCAFYKMLPIKELTSWSCKTDNKMQNLRKLDLMLAVQQALDVKLPFDPTNCFDEYYQLAQFETFGYAACICFALSFLKLCDGDGSGDGDAVSKDTVFTIFILDATNEQRACFSSIHLQFFFMLNKSINNLKLYFIGTTLTDAAATTHSFAIRAKNHTVKCESYKGTFKQFLQANSYCRPTLIITYNPDFTARNQLTMCAAETYVATYAQEKLIVAETLQLMVEMPYVPIFFTSRTQLESKRDYTMILDAAMKSPLNLSVKRILDCRAKCPYGALIPHRNVRRGEPDSYYFLNYYMQGIMTSR